MQHWWNRYRPIVLLALIILAIVVACTGCYAMVKYTPEGRSVIQIAAEWSWSIAHAWLGEPKQDEFMQFLQAVTWFSIFWAAWEVLTNFWKIISYPWKIVAALRRNENPNSSMPMETDVDLEAEKLYGTVPPGYMIYRFRRPSQTELEHPSLFNQQDTGIDAITDRWVHPSQYDDASFFQVIAPSQEIAIAKANKYVREGRTDHTY